MKILFCFDPNSVDHSNIMYDNYVLSWYVIKIYSELFVTE